MTRQSKALILGLLIVLIVAACAGVLIARGETGAKGLAMVDWSHSEDLLLLNVSWHYGWGEYCAGQPGCIDMVRAMQLPSACSTFLLVGNEPNAVEPYGFPIAPKDAARKVSAIEKRCPQTRLVVGNVSADDWSTVGGWGSGYNWLRSFLAEYRRYTRRAYSGALGVHCYTIHSASWCVEQLGRMRSAYAGEMWLTEFGVTDGDPVEFAALVDYAASAFTRYAVYTNRQPPAPCAWCGPRALDLVNADGSLTANGAYYSER